MPANRVAMWKGLQAMSEEELGLGARLAGLRIGNSPPTRQELLDQLLDRGNRDRFSHPGTGRPGNCNGQLAGPHRQDRPCRRSPSSPGVQGLGSSRKKQPDS